MSTLHELFTSRMVSQRVICETAFIMGPTSKSCHKVSHFYYNKFNVIILSSLLTSIKITI